MAILSSLYIPFSHIRVSSRYWAGIFGVHKRGANAYISQAALQEKSRPRRVNEETASLSGAIILIFCYVRNIATRLLILPI